MYVRSPPGHSALKPGVSLPIGSHYVWADYVSREGPLNSFVSRVTQGERSYLQEMDASGDAGRLISDDEGL
jgi:hypothetical protein